MNSKQRQDREVRDWLARIEVPDHKPTFWAELNHQLRAESDEPRSMITQSPGRRRRRMPQSRALFAAASLAALIGIGVFAVSFLPRETVDIYAGNRMDHADPDEPPQTTNKTNTTDGITTRSSPATVDEASASVTPSTFETGQLTEGGWTEPELLTDQLSLGRVLAVPGDSSGIIYEEAVGTTDEGCEGSEPINRYVKVDLNTGNKTVLTGELGMGWHSLRIGPAGRVALVRSCDANSVLAAVGQLEGDALNLSWLDRSSEDAIWGSGNAGVDIVWSPSGDSFYFNTTLVDAATGDAIATQEWNAEVHIRATTANGQMLISQQDRVDTTSFWLVAESDVAPNAAPEEAPLFRGQATYPNSDIELSPDGTQLLVTIDRSTVDQKTYIVGPEPDQVSVVEGSAVMSPDGTKLLVTPVDETSHYVVDFASGERSVVPQLMERPALQRVLWTGDGSGLFIVPHAYLDFSEDAKAPIYYTEPIRSD